ncbi:hypothetical protein NFHSH190041_24690 [Shewanella sp. NFH-SH190041]|uniref:TonB-dependent receptor n=1 Tax=Shewanella sp. NFH-SH190041 TaxID=2950245 RepID=UPI0021C4A5DA|nr:TonB-dependent receptor [Shewanella sp. NFH-SH190041]BDM65017.1 hypothetical protein NFHSH190041_24690 [Shewanella sp. NFH-SH190041]
MHRNILTQSVRLAIFGGAASIALSIPMTVAAEEVERIEVTGSSIKRTDMEGALPLDIITAADIKKTGVTSVPDLIATLPSMQGFIAEGESVGGGGGGIQTASLRDLGSQYTLVLLNGRRMASADSGGTVDLNSIPLSAISRVEILKDGASALYGSDAIAGVVNFILKSDLQETTVSARYDKPKDTSSSNFSLTTGFGDLGADGFNILAAISHDQKDRLSSTDRDFAKTGFIEFEHAGQNLVAVSGSSNAIPGNAYVTYNQRDENGALTGKTKTYSFNPYKEQNGQCHTTSAPSGNACQFDYTSTLEIQPENKRTNAFVQGLLEINDATEAYATASWAKFEMITRIAPYPTGLIPLPNDADVVKDNVLPYLPTAWKDSDGVEQNILADMTKVAARWRVLPGGNRTTEYDTTTTHFVTGLRGDIAQWSYDVALTKADAKRDENRLTGYPLEKEFMDLAKSGAVNIFASPEDLSTEQKQMVKDTMFSGNWETTKTSMFAVEAKASGEVFEMPAGGAYLGFGMDYRKASYERTISAANAAEVVLFESAGDEFDLSRDTYGAFAELVVPVIEDLEVTAALRYDNIGEVTDSRRTGNQTVNSSDSDVTYKLSTSYRPNEQWLLRASYGTGFKAPTMRQIAEPRIEYGVTSVAYDCPANLSADKSQYCYSDKLQYDVYRQGNEDLKSETSEQFTAGFVWAGDNDISFSADYWQIDMENQVRRLTQNQIFNNADLYGHLFVTREDPGTGDTVLAIVQKADNVGKSKAAGIDWQLNMTNEFDVGTLKTSLVGTYMIENKSLKVGTDNVWDSSLGRVGPNEAVTFRNIIAFYNSFTHGGFTHNLNVNWKSGYHDAPASSSFTVYEAKDGGWGDKVDASLIQKYVKPYYTIDYRLNYSWQESLDVALGVKNLLDEQPPLTFNGAAGHQVGYDPRYADPYGRTFYLQVDYTF